MGLIGVSGIRGVGGIMATSFWTYRHACCRAGAMTSLYASFEYCCKHCGQLMGGRGHYLVWELAWAVGEVVVRLVLGLWRRCRMHVWQERLSGDLASVRYEMLC